MSEKTILDELQELLHKVQMSQVYLGDEIFDEKKILNPNLKPLEEKMKFWKKTENSLIVCIRDICKAKEIYNEQGEAKMEKETKIRIRYGPLKGKTGVAVSFIGGVTNVRLDGEEGVRSYYSSAVEILERGK